MTKGIGGRPLRLAILISGRGSNLRAIIEEFGPQRGSSPIEIVLVLADRPAPGLDHARAAGLPAALLPYRDFATRADFEAALDRALREAKADFVALAGFLRILGPDFLTRWRDRVVNIHPSLLPALPGLDTHRRALALGLRFHGCTTHIVREALDDGPILAQAVLPIRAEDDAESLAARVLGAEHRLYPATLRLIAEGRVEIEGDLARIREAAFGDGILFNPLGA